MNGNKQKEKKEKKTSARMLYFIHTYEKSARCAMRQHSLMVVRMRDCFVFFCKTFSYSTR